MTEEQEFDESYLKLLTKPWQKFFNKFKDIETLPVSEWGHVHQLAYFSKKYKQHFGSRFCFSMRKAPSKSEDVFMIKKIMSILGTTNPRTVKEYIDWVFGKKIIVNDKKIRTLGFFASARFCNEFNIQKNEQNKISRFTEIPQQYKAVIEKFSIPVNTFGDLAFAKQSMDTCSEGDALKAYQMLFNELYKVGFEFDMLKDLR